MPFTHINAIVRLKADVPEYQLRRGGEGVIVSVWLLPGDFRYQVEFYKSNGSVVYAKLSAGQLEIIRTKSGRMAMG